MEKFCFVSSNGDMSETSSLCASWDCGTRGAEDVDTEPSSHWMVLCCCFWGFYNCCTHLSLRIIVAQTMRQFPPWFLLDYFPNCKRWLGEKIKKGISADASGPWRHCHAFTLSFICRVHIQSDYYLTSVIWSYIFKSIFHIIVCL